MVTVVMPVFNCEKFLDESIQSILGQTYSNFTFIIINDGSTDGSLDIIKTYLGDKRIKLISFEENKGLIKALNVALENISTKYLIRMDADDSCHLDRVRILVEFMEVNPQIGICGTKVGPLDDKEIFNYEIIEDYEIKASHLWNCSITHASAIYRYQLFRKYSLKYDYNYPHSEDNALITDILLYSKGAIINKNLYWVREHPGQVSNLFKQIQRDSSSKRRNELLELDFHLNLTQCERNLYKYLSYKERGISLDEFGCIASFISKIYKLNSLPNKYEFDRRLFRQIVKRRVRVIYLINYNLGFRLFVSYFKLYFYGLFPGFGFRLFLKILLSRLGFFKS